MNKKDLWQAVLAELQLTLSKVTFATWFSQTKIEKIQKISKDHQIVEISVNNPYIKDTVEERYFVQIKEILDRVTDKKNEPKFVVALTSHISHRTSQALGPLFQKTDDKEKARLIKKAILRTRLIPEFTFENFAVSSTNEMAHAAASAVAKSPGKAYHLLFLYGGVGVGKTHLAQAIGNRVLENDYTTSVVYCTAEEFTNEIISAIQTKSTPKFREKHRKAKVLLIDDVQFIAGKEKIQEEFFHTFNAVRSDGGQVVLTSDQLPTDIEGLEDRLCSRFEGGLTIDIQQPSFELRTAILLIKAKQKNLPLPMDVAQLIAANVESTRKLEGFLIRLLTESELKKEPITPEMAQSLLGKVGQKKEAKKRLVKPKGVLEQVSNYFSLKTSDLRGIKRAKPIVVPRQIAMYFLRSDLKLTYTEIGDIFGGKDHTTVMHSCDKITKQLTFSERLRLDVTAIRKRLFG